MTATLRGSRCHSSDDLFRGGENGRWASLFFLSFPAVSPASAGAQKEAGGLRWSGFSRTEKVWGKKKEENLKRKLENDLFFKIVKKPVKKMANLVGIGPVLTMEGRQCACDFSRVKLWV